MPTFDPSLVNQLYPRQQQNPVPQPLGPNRYIPPTFSFGRNGERPDYNQMNWNTMQQYYMPQQNNDTFTNPYMSSLQNMLQQFGSQYGSPNRQPQMPFQQQLAGMGGQQGGQQQGWYNSPRFNQELMMRMLGGMSREQMMLQSYQCMFGFGRAASPNVPPQLQYGYGADPNGATYTPDTSTGVGGTPMPKIPYGG